MPMGRSDDERECGAEVVGEGVLGGEGLLAGADLDGAVAAGGADEPADGPASAVLDEGERAGLGFQLAVDGLVGAGEPHEPVTLDGGLPGDGFLRLGDLVVDPAQGAPGAVGLVLVVDDLVTALVGGAGGPGLGEDLPVGGLGVGWSRRQVEIT